MTPEHNVNFVQRESGLLVPQESTPPPEPPPKEFGPLELTDPLARKLATTCLQGLWKAMGLHRSRTIPLPGDENHDTYLAAWESMSTMLLGDEAPECEVQT